MTLLVVLGCVAAFFAAYLAIGFGYIAPRYVTCEVADSIRKYPTIATPGNVAEWRRFAASMAWGTAIVWPFYLLGRAGTAWIHGRSPLTDHELKVKTEQQAKRIAELERELGITGREATRG